MKMGENPFLSGVPLPKSCNENGPHTAVPEDSTRYEKDDNLSDMGSNCDVRKH